MWLACVVLLPHNTAITAKLLCAAPLALPSFPVPANVIRGGKRFSVDASELVPGDVVAVKSGDRLPADLRLLQVHGRGSRGVVLHDMRGPVWGGVT